MFDDFFTVCTGVGLKKKKREGKLESLNSGDEGGYFRRLIVWNTNLHRKTAQGAAYFLHPSASFGCWPIFILPILFIFIFLLVCFCIIAALKFFPFSLLIFLRDFENYINYSIVYIMHCSESSHFYEWDALHWKIFL